MEEIERAKLDVEDRRSEVIKREDAMAKKIKVLESLTVKQAQLEERELLVDKANAIDIERKRLLDLREERIATKEKRIGLDRQE